MLHFFRKMRKALIPESRFGRYFFYALGEIVLVVIGILLALQINIWNQERKNRNEEKTILSNLNNEFRENKKLIAEQIELFGQFDIACKKLMSLMNKTPEELSKINVDKHYL